MTTDRNVIFHTMQREISHSPNGIYQATPSRMDENEAFRENLLRLMAARGYSAAELSRKASLNARAVKDIEERRAQSPKLSTVFALARALGADPGEMIGLGPRIDLAPELARYLSRYSVSDQERLLQALSALPVLPSEKP
jgi:transcriptional regulator with XRE-family HTH domain